MRTLIIPCMGGRLINGIPLYLNTHPSGELIARKCIDSIDCEGFDQIISVQPKIDEERYNSKRLVEEEFSDVKNFSVVVLDETNDAVETIAKTIEKLNISGEIVIKDINNRISFSDEVSTFGNFIAGIDMDQIGRDIHDLHKMCFIAVNENDAVMNIVEKQVCSEHMGVGMYGFADAGEFLFAASKLSDTRYSLQRRYISHVVSYLLGYNESVFHYIRAREYECWNDEKTWGELQRSKALYFVDVDYLIGNRLDEFLGGKEAEMLRFMSNNGASFIGFTARDEVMKRKVKDMFNGLGINILQIVYGCPVTSEKRLIMSSEDIRKYYYNL